MPSVSDEQRQICSLFFGILMVFVFGFSVTAAHQCNHGHDHHHHAHDEDVGVVKKNQQQQQQLLLPEEIAELEDLKLMMAHHDHEHGHGHKHDGDVELSGFGLWIHAMGCSLLVSLASLICLIFLPLIFTQGKPSKSVVDSLALFGAGAMLGDAFLHQLPHAFGGEHSHSHDHHDGHAEHHGHFGSHSFQDLSIGLSILAGIVIFLIVERLVRYVDDFSGGVNTWSLGHHHHHHHKHINNLKDDHEDAHENPPGSAKEKNERSSKNTFEENECDGLSAGTACGNKQSEKDVLRKRNTGRSSPDNLTDLCADNISNGNAESINREPPTKSQLNLVFGYLTSSQMECIILPMGWHWEVPSSFMDQLVGDQELCFCSLMSYLKRTMNRDLPNPPSQAQADSTEKKQNEERSNGVDD